MALKQPKTDVSVDFYGEDGNIFNLAGKVTKALKRNGYYAYAREVQDRLFLQKSYEDAIAILGEYVEIV